MALAMFQRLAALAEVLTVLVLGNIIGLSVFQLIVPNSVSAGTASPSELALWEGILIFLRLGLAGLFGYLLLYYRRGTTPRQAGLTRNGQSLPALCKKGFLLGVVTVLPISALFATRALFPFGDGLPAWWTYNQQNLDRAFLISLLGTSVLIPPLVEEILTRGYQRVRLVENFGDMSGVLLAALIFALAHTRYLSSDPMLFLFFLTLVFSSICWTYLAQKTGSIIPPLVAHAVTNGTASLILFEVWTPLVTLLVIAAIYRKAILETVFEFIHDWRADKQKVHLVQALLFLAAVFIPGLLLLPYLGRVPTLASIGALLFIFTLANLITEKRLQKMSRADA